MAFTAGNRAHEHSHDEAKYEKFVYSTVFGFSVSKAQKLLRGGAFDNMLALSGIKALKGYGGAQVVVPEPNTNLMAPRTFLPTLTARLSKGESVLVCAVLGTETGGRSLWENMPLEVQRYAGVE